MRHLVNKFKLSRTNGQRTALAKGLLLAVAEKGSITTTRTKAKFIQPFVERCMSRAKTGEMSDIKFLTTLIGENAAFKLVHHIAPGYTRNSGFSRIVPLGFRRGDNTEIVKLELLEKDVEVVIEPKTKVAKASKPAKITQEKSKPAKKEVKAAKKTK